MVRISILKRHFVNRLIAFFLILLCTPLQVRAAESISIPSEYGRIDQIQNGTNGKTIILIQSAHTLYEAQKSIAEILRNLIQNENLNLILAEGGWGDVRLSHLRHLAPEDKRREIAEQYLKEGKITGDEYLDLTSDLDMMIWGVESKTDYQANMEVFLKFYEVQNSLFEETKKLEQSLTAAEQKLLPQEVLDFLAQKRSFQENKTSILDYVSFLSKQTNYDEFPLIKQLIALSGNEGIDSSKIELEKDNLMKALSAKVTKLELEQFTLSKERKSIDDEIGYLKLLLAAHQKYQSKLPRLQIENLGKSLKALESINSQAPDEMFHQTVALEKKVLGQFPLTEAQKSLLDQRYSLELLKRLFSLEVAPADYEQIKNNSFDDILKPESGVNLDLIRQWIPAAVSFYESAQKREKSLIENSIQKINETEVSSAVLLVGGFHSEHLASEFHKLGFSVIKVSPRFVPSVNSNVDSRQYFEILKYKWGTGNAVTSNLKAS